MRLRIPQELYEEVRADLRRPHPFADERVGFVFVRANTCGDGAKILFALDYQSIPDEFYVDKPDVGACIGSSAIRAVMECSLASHCGVFHVHEHRWPGCPRYSLTDREGWDHLIPCFHRVVSDLPHGAVVFSPDAAAGIFWSPNVRAFKPLAHISVVGFPMRKLL